MSRLGRGAVPHPSAAWAQRKETPGVRSPPRAGRAARGGKAPCRGAPTRPLSLVTPCPLSPLAPCHPQPYHRAAGSPSPSPAPPSPAPQPPASPRLLAAPGRGWSRGGMGRSLLLLLLLLLLGSQFTPCSRPAPGKVCAALAPPPAVGKRQELPLQPLRRLLFQKPSEDRKRERSWLPAAVNNC